MAHSEMLWLVLRFVLCSACISVWTWSKRSSGAGLMLGYWFGFMQNYAISAVLHALPYQQSEYYFATLIGFGEAELSFELFTLGAITFTTLLRLKGHLVSEHADSPIAAQWPPVGHLFAVGLLIGYVFAPFFSRVPSGAAVASTLANLAPAAWALASYRALTNNKRILGISLIAGSVIFPLNTVVFHGFIGFGINSVVLIVSLVAIVWRPKWTLVPLVACLLFLALSVYVTYMRDREDVRENVWGGQSIGDRVKILTETFSKFDWFDPRSEEQMALIDGRMNQNWLIGMAIARFELGEVSFAKGQTLLDAVLAVIPRALWPDKPMRAGSGDLVAEYTGIEFAEGTSVGIGPIMEIYINFGRVGLILGSFLLGAFLGYCDIKAGQYLRLGYTTRFAGWLLVGLPILSTLGSLVSIFTSIATGLVLQFLFKAYWEPKDPALLDFGPHRACVAHADRQTRA